MKIKTIKLGNTTGVKIGNVIIISSAAIKSAIEDGIKRCERGEEAADHTLMWMIGTYSGRIFGVCIYRQDSGEFIDKAVRRYIAAKYDFTLN